MSELKVLITGGKGMLGRTLEKSLSDYRVVVGDLPNVNILESDKLLSYFTQEKPDVVIHCAAMTAVDDCESQIDLSYKLNALGSANVARASKVVGARLMAISTDYVFSGDSQKPYNEYDVVGPKSIYGKSKLAGEQEIFRLCPDAVVARISWLYGPGGPSFYHTMLALAEKGLKELKVVDDQIGNPTSTLAVARGIKSLLDRKDVSGVVHLTCEGEATWCDFAKKIFELHKIDMTVTPCKTDEFPRPAPRPSNSRLDNMVLRMNEAKPMMHWVEALQEMIEVESK